MKGHFLATVSAAGLLTMPGHAPYAVTKHAALAFAEWLSMTYGDRGDPGPGAVPAGRPDADARGERRRWAGGYSSPGRSSAADVAELVVASLDGGPFLLLPHPEVAPLLRRPRRRPRRVAGRHAPPHRLSLTRLTHLGRRVVDGRSQQPYRPGDVVVGPAEGLVDGCVRPLERLSGGPVSGVGQNVHASSRDAREKPP